MTKDIDLTLKLSEFLSNNSDRREKEVGDRVKIFDFSYIVTIDGSEFDLYDEGATDTFIVIEKSDSFPTSDRFWKIKEREEKIPLELRDFIIGKPNDLLITNGNIKLYIRSIQVQLLDFKKNQNNDTAEVIKKIKENFK